MMTIRSPAIDHFLSEVNIMENGAITSGMSRTVLPEWVPE